MKIQTVLEQVKQGVLSTEEAEAVLKDNYFAEMGYAKLDTDRKNRTGFAEVVFCSGKNEEQLISIYQRIYEAEGEVLGTRASGIQYEKLREVFPEVCYDPASRILKIEKKEKKNYNAH